MLPSFDGGSFLVGWLGVLQSTLLNPLLRCRLLRMPACMRGLHYNSPLEPKPFVSCPHEFHSPRTFSSFGSLCWVIFAERRLSLVVNGGGYSWLWCAGFSLQWPLLLPLGSRAQAQHGLGCSVACGIFLDQGWNQDALQGGFLTT